KSPRINDAIRLLAFTDWMNGRSEGHILLVSSNLALAECLNRWCIRKGVGFEWQREEDKASPLSWFPRQYARLPHALRALIWLVRQVRSRWALRRVGQEAWRQSQGHITFVSYLFNLIPASASKGFFESGYWGNLPETLCKEGVKTNWLHLYINDGLLPNSKEAAAQINRFNQTGKGMQNHVTLHSFMSMTVLSRVLRDWFGLMSKGWDLRMRMEIPRLDELELWPLFIDDWYSSVSGVSAMNNLLFLNLFEKALGEISKQRIGVYLLENQGWELGMLQSWKSNGHGEIVGYAHSTVRYWDLRYFFDPRSYRSKQPNQMPMPDRVAVNGSVARQAYIAGGYPAQELVDVEALRYLYLNQFDGESRKDYEVIPISTSEKVSSRRLLVLSAYMETHTRVQMRLLNDIADDLPYGIEIIVKPHPAMPVSTRDYPRLLFSVTSLPISELLAQTDLVYTSAVTSAAVDAYCASLPVISVLDPVTLNMSPLRGCKGVRFVESSAELAYALNEAVIPSGTESQAALFFNLDTRLLGWKRLLGMIANSSRGTC
uniref:TIGR04326 family surface carbohydrate biosynthesis protein n=1 Tax=Rheinheimera sp. TaxID=1869214 RepID=UPI00404813D8